MDSGAFDVESENEDVVRLPRDPTEGHVEMMTYHLRSISYINAGIYDVAFARDGGVVVVRCTVFEHGGISAVQPDPDIFMSGLVDTRVVSAAVIAFDRAARGPTAEDPDAPIEG